MGMLSLLLIQMFPQFVAVAAIYLIVSTSANVFQRARAEHADRRDHRLPRRRDGRAGVADEGLLRHDPDGARRVGARRRRDAGPDLLGRRPAARRAGARRRRADLVRLHAERVRDRVGAPADDEALHAAGRPATASSTRTTTSTGGRSRPARCSPRSRSRRSSCSCSGASSAASPPARSRDEPAGVERRHGARRAAPRRLRRCTSLERPERARRRGGRPAARPARAHAPTASLLPLRARRRAARRRGRRSTRRRTPTSGGARRSRSGTRSRATASCSSGGDVGYAWVNALGLTPHEVTDADDFAVIDRRAGARRGTSSRSSTRSSPTASRPRSLDVERAGLGDRRDRGTRCRPAAARRRRTSSTAATCAASSSTSTTSRSLGANLIYLTPFFPATSSAPLRRDDASTTSTRCSAATTRSRSLCDAAHARGIRVIGDITLNHTGLPARVVRARAGGSRTRPSAPSTSSTRRSRTATSRGSASRRCRSSTGAATSCAQRFADVLRRYLDARPRRLARRRREHGRPLPRRRPEPRGLAAGRASRSATRSSIAEHGHDFRPDLGVRGWHGVMNYSGFLRPLWTWLLPRRSRARAAGAVLGHPGRRPAARRRGGGRGAAPLPRRRARGRRCSTRGTCSTATTRRASARSPARPSATSSASGCR